MTTKPQEKRWFTVVFCGPALDSYNSRMTHFRHIKGSTFEDALKASKLEPTAVWFAFEGAQNPVTDWTK